MDEYGTPPIAGLKNAVEKRILPVKAGDASPVVIRAMDKLRKAYPASMTGVSAPDMSMDDPRAFSSILASVPIHAPMDYPGGGGAEFDRGKMEINPGVSMTFPQLGVERTMAHELQHVRQNRYGDPETRMRQHETLPYRERPDELEADYASKNYRSTTPGVEIGSPQDFLQNSMIYHAGELKPPGPSRRP